jgi:hypothetical protein
MGHTRQIIIATSCLALGPQIGAGSLDGLNAAVLDGNVFSSVNVVDHGRVSTLSPLALRVKPKAVIGEGDR